MRVIKYILLSLLCIPEAFAQNVMTSSPYSMFGLGEIMSGLYGQQVGMGGVAYGMRNPLLLSMENPAGLTGIDTCRLLAEVSTFLKREQYQSGGNSNGAFTGNVSAISLGGRIIPRWYAAAGVTPYSSAGYYFRSAQPLEGTPASVVNSLFEGDGGLSEASFTNAILLPGHFSLGINLNYIFGNLSQTETQEATSVRQSMHTQSFYTDFGLQYQRRLSRQALVTLGAVYGYKQRLRIENTLALTIASSVTETNKKKTIQYLPQYTGIGGALQYKQWTYALDYTLREYHVLTSGDSRIKFVDAHELRAGVSYLPSTHPSEGYWKRVTYKAGIMASTPYYTISGKSGFTGRACIGLGLPVQNGQINAAFFYDRLQMQGNALQRDIIGLTVTYTLSERFYKAKL
ncbi:MAG: hypothetical protein LBL07_09820 [Tannerella sp.]|jgi:hypothetical protein|nr:hypothetical protein [Tannerella sp.]